MKTDVLTVFSLQVISFHGSILSEGHFEGYHDVVQQTLNHLHSSPHIVVDGTQVSPVARPSTLSGNGAGVLHYHISDLQKTLHY